MPDRLFLDPLVLPIATDNHNGKRFLDAVREIRRRFPATYVIMFTGKGSEEIAVELMKAGAADYVLENAANGTAVGVTAFADDADGPDEGGVEQPGIPGQLRFGERQLYPRGQDDRRPRHLDA